MKKLKDYRKIALLVDQIRVEKVYPLSILEGIQKGEISGIYRFETVINFV